MGITGNISKVTQDGENCEVEWNIQWTSLSEEVGAFYFRPYFDFKDRTWFLLTYPNGGRNSGYMDFCLCRICDGLIPITVEFSFSLKTVSGNKDSEKSYKREFSIPNLDHSTDKFLSTSDFKKRQSDLLDSGFLTVLCAIKILNSSESKGESRLYYFEGSVASSNAIF